MAKPVGLVPITARTRLVGLIGDPVDHSRSPAMHNAAFRALGLPWAYLAFGVGESDVGAAIAGVRSLGLAGVNVTIPHKQAVIRHLDKLSPRALACGAVNTIVVRRHGLLGENTDVIGLERDWEELEVPGRIVDGVVLGAGGSARAAAVALARRSRRVIVAARRPLQARALVRSLRKSARGNFEAVDLAELRPGAPGAPALLGRAGLVVNATSSGMKGERFFPLAFDATPSSCVFYDLIYTAKRTPFLAEASARPLRRATANGLGMLLHQGAAAFEIWTGVDAPLDVMRRALRREP